MFRTFVCSVLMLGASANTVPAPDTTAEIMQFRKEMEDAAKDPHGYLALVALQWLAGGDTTVGSAETNKLKLPHLPAHAIMIRQQDGKATLVMPAGGFDACLKLNGQAPRAQTLTSDVAGKPDELTCNGVAMTVIGRGDRLYLRVRDAQSPTLLAFHGLHWYPVKPAYQFTAKWVPYPAEQQVSYKNVLGQSFTAKVPGYAEFQVNGTTVRLQPTSVGKDRLWFIFRDTTSKSETYGAGRFLQTDLPTNGTAKPGAVLLDFNTAYNPPCAYTPFATCPLPPAGNRLSVALHAGEKRFHD